MKKISFNKDLFFRLQNNVNVKGLDAFKKSLEKDFFCEATIRSCTSSKGVINLVIELDLNFGLVETIYYHKRNSLYLRESNENNSMPLQSFHKALAGLRAKNDIPVTIEELSIYLDDTSFIIHKIYDQSISHQIDTIIEEIANHYVSYTKELTEIPYEIHIPVFRSDQLLENKNIISREKEYYAYWAAYFNSESEAFIYDLDKRTMVNGELFLLNQQ